jgi:catechol 2,3-dioxygenase-like lactoylglutathione lyase family enzyme
MAYTKRAYCEHVAIRVKDIDWHLRFFREALGMDIRDELAAGGGNPRQVWTVRGIQLIADPGFAGPEGRLAHLGIMVEDLDEALPPLIGEATPDPCRNIAATLI